MISVVVLPKLGVHQAMRLFLTGRASTPREALGYGLLHRVVPADGLDAAVQEEIDAIALGGPNAVAEAKRLVRTVSRLPMDEAFAYAGGEDRRAVRVARGRRGHGGVRAKRKPSWVPGRAPGG